MPQTASLPIDFPALKRALSGSSKTEQISCGVVMLDDGSASLKVDRRKKPKMLARELLAESRESGLESKKCLYGTAYMDEFPGTLCLALNKTVSSLNTKLRIALRGSGFGKVEITVSEDEEA